jgi:galactokinase/mevalonate kinase-like predicted kinase
MGLHANTSKKTVFPNKIHEDFARKLEYAFLLIFVVSRLWLFLAHKGEAVGWDVGGGGSDLPSFFETYGGAVLNVAINLYSYTKLSKAPKGKTTIVSHDWEITRQISELALEFGGNKKDNVDIVKAVMAECGLSPSEGYELLIHSMAPKNSGLAGSSALIVSLLGAMFNMAGLPMLDRNMFAKTAYHIEREVLRRPCRLGRRWMA